jgi:hypothetical protein
MEPLDEQVLREYAAAERAFLDTELNYFAGIASVARLRRAWQRREQARAALAAAHRERAVDVRAVTRETR